MLVPNRASVNLCTRIALFLTVIGAGLPMGLAVATGLFAPWLDEHGASVQSISAEWRAVLVLSGLLVAAGVALTLAAQWFAGPNRPSNPPQA